MKKLLLNIVAAIATVFGLAVVAGVAPVSATGYPCPGGGTATSLEGCKLSEGSNAQQDGLMKTANTAINVVVGLVGFVAVVMIVIGGIGFATSQGDTAKTTKARNTILYGVIGLVVAVLAFAIVNFVLSNVF